MAELTMEKLLEEKERLELELASTSLAKAKLSQIERMIVLYGSDGHAPAKNHRCGRRGCGKAFATEKGLDVHQRRMHG